MSDKALPLYRNIHRLIRRLPKPHSQPNLLSQLRTSYEANRTATTPEQIDGLITKGEQNLSFLRMNVGGRRPSSKNNATGSYVYSKDDKTVTKGRAGHTAGAKYSNWGPGNMDPDSVKTHNRQLKRAGFTNNQSVIGDLGF